MKRLTRADCTDEYGTRELVDWINEIHRWGLSQHGPSCERGVVKEKRQSIQRLTKSEGWGGNEESSFELYS